MTFRVVNNSDRDETEEYLRARIAVLREENLRLIDENARLHALLEEFARKSLIREY